MCSAEQLSPLEEAARKVGSMTRLAEGLGVSRRAVRKWIIAGRMPRTEWTGETAYSKQIEALTEQAVTKDVLLKGWPAPSLLSQREAAGARVAAA